MENQKTTLMVMLDLSAAFDTVKIKTLIDIFEFKYNIKGLSLQWIISYLTKRHQKVTVNGMVSEAMSLKHGVPQGSCMGPLAFLAYLSPLQDIIDLHSPTVEAYADDTQLYISFDSSDTYSVQNAIDCMERCIADVREYMLKHQLKINDDKTVVLTIGSRQQLSKLPEISVRVGNSIIKPSNQATNLGVIFDSNMSLSQQISNVRKKSFYQLTKIKQLKKYLDSKTTELLTHAFVSSNIDYCNSLYYNLPKKQIKRLQSIQNSAARVITNTRKYDRISPVLKDLHWLPIQQRIVFKIALMTFKCRHNLSPEYLQSSINERQQTRTLRSNSRQPLLIQRVTTNMGGRSFLHAAPTVWNNLPVSLTQITNINTFKKQLKTYLFEKVYN